MPQQHPHQDSKDADGQRLGQRDGGDRPSARTQSPKNRRIPQSQRAYGVTDQENGGAAHDQGHIRDLGEHTLALPQEIEEPGHSLAGQRGLGKNILVDFLVKLVEFLDANRARHNGGYLHFSFADQAAFGMGVPVAFQWYEDGPIQGSVRWFKNAHNGVISVVGSGRNLSCSSMLALEGSVGTPPPSGMSTRYRLPLVKGEFLGLTDFAVIVKEAASPNLEIRLL